MRALQIGHAARKGPRFALDRADRIKAGIEESYPGEVAKVIAFNSERVVYTLDGDAQLLASTYELDGDEVIVSASLWPRHRPKGMSRDQRLDAIDEQQKRLALALGVRPPGSAPAANPDFAEISAPPDAWGGWGKVRPPYAAEPPNVAEDYTPMPRSPFDRPAAPGGAEDYAAIPAPAWGR